MNQHVYLSEDESDGRFYRFVPDGQTADHFADLSAGKLEVAEVRADNTVIWHALPAPAFTGATATRLQVPQSTVFRGGDGLFSMA